jgi:hypothetical protein
MAEYQATPSSTAPAGDFPGKTLGIVGLVLAIVAPVIGVVVSAIAMSQSKKAGYPNKLAKDRPHRRHRADRGDRDPLHHGVRGGVQQRCHHAVTW